MSPGSPPKSLRRIDVVDDQFTRRARQRIGDAAQPLHKGGIGEEGRQDPNAFVQPSRARAVASALGT